MSGISASRFLPARQLHFHFLLMKSRQVAGRQKIFFKIEKKTFHVLHFLKLGRVLQSL